MGIVIHNIIVKPMVLTAYLNPESAIKFYQERPSMRGTDLWGLSTYVEYMVKRRNSCHPLKPCWNPLFPSRPQCWGWMNHTRLSSALPPKLGFGLCWI